MVLKNTIARISDCRQNSQSRRYDDFIIAVLGRKRTFASIAK